MADNWLDNLHAQHHGKTDPEWCALIRESIRFPEKFKRVLPGMPDVELQVRLNGQPAIKTYPRSRMFYLFLKEVMARHAKPVTENTRILDFGAGWGRLYRFFLKDVRLKNLVAADVSDKLPALWADMLPGASIHIIAPRPPMSFPDGDGFDLIYAHSVFSHLPAGLADAWATDFHSRLAPGGMFVMTTFGLSSNLGKLATGAEFTPQQIREKFAQGELVFFKPQSPDFGIALMPKSYIEARWGHLFEVVAYIDYRAIYAQAIVVLKKR